MRTTTGLIAIVILSVGGCFPSSGPLNNRQDQSASADVETKPAIAVQMYPILKYSRDQRSDVLLQHKATAAEKHLFKKMDSAVVALKGDPGLDRCYEVIVPIRREAGLGEKETIAFWTRMTFSEFEP